MSGNLVESTDYYPMTFEKCIITFGVLKHGIIRAQVWERVWTIEGDNLQKVINFRINSFSSFPKLTEFSTQVYQEIRLNYWFFLLLLLACFKNWTNASYAKLMLFNSDALQVSDIDIYDYHGPNSQKMYWLLLTGNGVHQYCILM